MIGLIMAGGKGTRMGEHTEKLALGKRPMITRVINALVDSKLCEKIITVASKNSPLALTIMKKDSRISVLETKGDGYVNDLHYALQKLEGDVIIMPGDLALLDAQILHKVAVMRTNTSTWTVIMASVEFIKSLGIIPSFSLEINKQECAYTGVSIVDATLAHTRKNIPESYKIINDKRIALNVNTQDNYAVSLEGFTEP